jgi:hypothetical protein
LDNVSEQTKLAICSVDAGTIIPSSNISTSLPSSVEKQIDNYLKDIGINKYENQLILTKQTILTEKYTHKVFVSAVSIMLYDTSLSAPPLRP